jgi:NADH-quinone oxidoreductase subunit E
VEEEQAKKAVAAAQPPAEPAKAAAPPAPPKSDPAPAKPPEAPAVKAQGEADRNKVSQAPQDPAARPGPANPPTTSSGGPGGSTVPSAGPAEAPSKTAAGTGAAAPAASPPVADEHKPAMLTAPRQGRGDDLKLIWGVGPKLEEMLNGMGIYHFDQIGQWNEMNLRWVDQNLGSFRGRAVRDDWIGQSKKLASGWRPERSIGDKPKA